MTREQLWAIYATKNPQFDSDGNVTLSSAGLKKLFNQTWDMATEEAKREPEQTAGERLFNQFFGGSRK